MKKREKEQAVSEPHEHEPPIIKPRARRKIKARPYRDKKRPNLKFVVGYREAGRRARKYFETREAAQSFAAFKNAERKQNGLEHSEFPTWLRVAAQEATERLQPFGKTITDAADHYVNYLEASARSCSVNELKKELLKSKESKGVGERHLTDLNSRLGRFAEAFGERTVATITSGEIDDWLHSLGVGPQTVNHYRAAVLSAFNFAVRRKYAPTNPVADTDKVAVVGETPGILDVETASALLVHAPKKILPYLAIGLFAGLRRAEIERLDWSEIDFESGLIEVTAANAKSAQRRFVTLQPNLREWLWPLRNLKGEVTPPEHWELFDAARAKAGIDEWPPNALRHSFASYHLAHFKNAASTALELGHHDSRVTFAHYRELVRPKEAKRYWQLKPAKAAGKIVPMVAR